MPREETRRIEARETAIMEPLEPRLMLSVTGFTLVNAATDVDIRPLGNNDTIVLSQDGSSLNVRADVTGSVTSVTFGLDGNSNYRTEGVAPYALEGDSNGDYNPWTPSIGSHTLIATPNSGSAMTINFDVVQDQPTGDPTASAGPNKNLVLPNNSVTLNGSGSDSDGSITGYLWTKESGPAATLSGTATDTLSLSNLVQGTYVFRLTVTDNDNKTDWDETTVTVAPAQSGGNIFQEADGLVVVEVESTPLEGDWVLETAYSGYTGTGYYRMNGNSVQSGNPNGALSYFINITNPGTYNLRIHSNKKNVGDDTWANDCYTKMVGHSGYQGNFTKTYQSGSSETWRWSTKHEDGSTHLDPQYTLSAGVHEFQIAGRSKDFIIDRFVLYKSPNDTGPGDQPQQSRIGYHFKRPGDHR